MFDRVATNFTTTISEFKKNPNESVALAHNEAFAVLTNNKPSFYVLPPKLYEKLIDMLDDFEIERIAIERRNDGSTPIRVKLEDL